jgi:hypothetical protein
MVISRKFELFIATTIRTSNPTTLRLSAAAVCTFPCNDRSLIIKVKVKLSLHHALKMDGGLEV